MSGLRLLGIVGAVLLFVGPTVAGAGFFNLASAQNNQYQCHSNCSSAFPYLLNATFELGMLEGAGIAIGGAGLGLVLVSTVTLLSQGRPTGPDPADRKGS